MPKDKVPETSFSALFAELETIAQTFEREQSDLDDAVKKFERGLTIANELKKRLEEVELRVKKIQKKFSDDNS